MRKHYLKWARVLHPDKHMDVRKKAEANVKFKSLINCKDALQKNDGGR